MEQGKFFDATPVLQAYRFAKLHPDLAINVNDGQFAVEKQYNVAAKLIVDSNGEVDERIKQYKDKQKIQRCEPLQIKRITIRQPSRKISLVPNQIQKTLQRKLWHRKRRSL